MRFYRFHPTVTASFKTPDSVKTFLVTNIMNRRNERRKCKRPLITFLKYLKTSVSVNFEISAGLSRMIWNRTDIYFDRDTNRLNYCSIILMGTIYLRSFRIVSNNIKWPQMTFIIFEERRFTLTYTLFFTPVSTDQCTLNRFSRIKHYNNVCPLTQIYVQKKFRSSFFTFVSRIRAWKCGIHD